MTKQEALNFIKQEKLTGYNFSGENLRENETGIQFQDGVWKVYSTDERASYRVLEEYKSEEEALDHMVACLRINKKFQDRYKRK